MSRYTILDLFCGGGGAGAGYFRAGFNIIGIDHKPQPDYPFKIWVRDAIHCTYDLLDRFDAIHASPPCQAYSRASNAPKAAGKEYIELYHQTKAMLIASGKPYIIENVVGSPAKGVRLMGTMFGLGVIRERVFESNVSLDVHLSRAYSGSVASGEYVTVAGNSKDAKRWRDAMGINWIKDNAQLKEAIPPDYTEFLGRQLMAYLINDDRQKDEKQPNHECRGLPENLALNEFPGMNEKPVSDKNREQLKLWAASHVVGASHVSPGA